HPRPVTLPFPTLNHDCALTRSNMVFVIDPLVVRLPQFLAGVSSLDRSVRFDRTKATQVILVPRDGGNPRIAECEPFFHYHINNAFEEGGDTVIDLVRYPDYDNIHRSFRTFEEADFHEVSTVLSRLRVSPSNAVEIEDILPFD